jgi:aminomethyltransferase
LTLLDAIKYPICYLSLTVKIQGVLMLKRTIFYNDHLKQGAKIVEFAGYKMPIQYNQGIVAEVKAVRSSAGLFDVSHMGEIEISGPEAIPFTNNLVTNDTEKLQDNQVLYTVMCLEDGGIIDDLLVYRRPQGYLLVVNGANQEKDWQWVEQQAKNWDVVVTNQSDKTCQLAIQGPKSEDIISKLIGQPVNDLNYYFSRDIMINQNPALLSRTGYTGEDGFEIYLDNQYASGLWDLVLEAGKEFGITSTGLGARDILRLEMGYCLYGNDITEHTTPLEAGLKWVVKMKKGDFIGKNSLQQQIENGVPQKLVPIIISGRQIPRKGYPIFADHQSIGEVTSGGWSPSLAKSIALGYVKKGYHKSGTEIEIEVRNRRIPAQIIKGSFYKQGSHL